MSGDIHNGLRSLAGAVLDLLPVPDGPTRETLLDLANPSRAKVREIIRKAVPDEKTGLRKLFKALDVMFLTDEQVSELALRGLDETDVHTITSEDEDTRERLLDLVHATHPEVGEPDEEPDEGESPYDQDAETERPLASYSEDELREALAALGSSKTEPSKEVGK